MHATSSAAGPHVAGGGPHPGIGFREFVAIVAALMAGNALAIDTMLPALPQIGAALGVTSEDQQVWIITAYVLGFGAAQIVYGPLSDRLGRRPVLLASLLAYAVFGIGAALSRSFAEMLAFRALDGAAIAATRVVTISVVRDCYGGRQMARVTSLAFMVFLIVPVLAPSLGQIIMTFVSWRGLFGMLAAYGALVFAWTWFRLPETLHPDFRRAIDLRTIGAAVATTVADRQSRGYMLAQAVVNGALLGFISSVQPIFADLFRAPARMPLVFAGIAGMMAAGSLLNSRLVELVGTRRLSHGAIIAFIVIEAGHLVVAGGGYETLPSFALFQGAAMFCFGLMFGNFGAMAMERLAAIAGTAASTQGAVVTVIGALLGYAIGAAFDGTTIPMTAGFAGGGVAALLLVLATERGRLFRPQMGI